MGFFSQWASGITFSPEEARELAQIIREETLQYPTLQELFTVIPGIVSKKRVPYAGWIEKITKKYIGCGQGEEEKSLPVSQKLWDPTPMRAWLSQCADELEQTFFVYLLKRGIERNDITLASPVVLEFLIEQFTRAHAEDAIVQTLFADTDIVAADLTDDDDLPYYTPYDGIFKKLEVIANADPRRYHEIAANAGDDYTAQDNLPADFAKTLFRKMVTSADPRTRQSSDLVIISTDSLVQNYIDTLEDKVLESSFTILQDGISRVRRAGVTIYGFPTLDAKIRADFDNGTRYDNPHRAFLYNKSNIMIGMDDPNAVGDAEVWYEKKEEKLHMRSDYKIDNQIGFDYGIQYAY